MASKGLTINCSMVENDGEYSLGFNYKDTEGFEFEGTYDGESSEEILEDLFNDVVEEILAFQEAQEEESEEEVEEDDEYTARLKKIIKELEEENNSLKTDLNILQRRADDAVKETMNKKAEEESSTKTVHGRYVINPFRFWF